MRASKYFALLILIAVSAAAAKKVVSPTTTASNEQIDLEATITIPEDEVTQKLGGVDPGKGIVILEVKVTPKTDKPIPISPDDFILLAHDDGERAKPFEPSEIAGQGAMIVSDKPAQQAKKSSSMGGFGGLTVGGGGASSPGNSKPVNLSAKVDTKTQGNAKLLEALKAKALTARESSEPVDGYLYFPLDGKHKLKNLAVLYRGPAGKLDLEFEH